MKIENWLYFRTVADEDNDDGDVSTAGVNPTSICIPASAVKQVVPSSDTSIKMHIDSCKLFSQSESGTRSKYNGADAIAINVTQGKAQEVMQALAEAISGNDQFVVVADDMTTNAAGDTVAARYLHPDITSLGTIVVYQTPQGRGIHEYYEEIRLNPDADADGEVVGSLSISLPAQCILLEGALTVIDRSDAAASSVALNFHSAAVADASAAGGTEWIGAGSASTVSIPDADLNCGSSDIAGDTLHSGTHPPVDRDTAVTHFALKTCEDSSGATINARIGVYVKWWGDPAEII